MKDFDSWNLHKKKIEGRIFNYYVNEREVWWCALGLNIGREVDGKNHLFERPVLIIKKLSKEDFLCVPLSSKPQLSLHSCEFVHGENRYFVMLAQVRRISAKRLLRRMYKIKGPIFKIIKQRLKELL